MTPVDEPQHRRLANAAPRIISNCADEKSVSRHSGARTCANPESVFSRQLPQRIAIAHGRSKFKHFQVVPGSLPFAVSAVADRDEAY
jgi:hypothetical protein